MCFCCLLLYSYSINKKLFACHPEIVMLGTVFGCSKIPPPEISVRIAQYVVTLIHTLSILRLLENLAVGE